MVPFLYTHNAGVMSDQWENIVIPEIFDDFGNHYSFSHHIPTNIRHSRSFLIKSLEPGTHYEARVQARNDHGWNKLSSIFHFTTRSEGELNGVLGAYNSFILFTPVFLIKILSDADSDNAIHPEVYHGAELLDKSVLNAAAFYQRQPTTIIFLSILLSYTIPLCLTYWST